MAYNKQVSHLLVVKDVIFRQPFSTVNTRVSKAIIPVKEHTTGLTCSYLLPGPSAVLCSRSYAAITWLVAVACSSQHRDTLHCCSLVSCTLDTRASNEGSQRFHNHGH